VVSKPPTVNHFFSSKEWNRHILPTKGNDKKIEEKGRRSTISLEGSKSFLQTSPDGADDRNKKQRKTLQKASSSLYVSKVIYEGICPLLYPVATSLSGTLEEPHLRRSSCFPLSKDPR
jgi:hypothetical protein